MVLALQDQESTALPMYEQQLQEANTGINNLLNAIQQGILTKSTKSRLEELEAARDELENKIALEKLAKPRISEEFVRFFLERFRNLDLSKLEHRKMLIEVFLNAVYVFNDKIVISCNYKDGTKTVNFSEMESALTLRASVSGSDLDCPGAPEGEIRTGFPLFRCCQLGKEVRAEFFACASAAGHFYPGQNAMARKSRIPSAFFGRRVIQTRGGPCPSRSPAALLPFLAVLFRCCAFGAD